VEGVAVTNGRLAALIVVLGWLLTFVAPTIHAQSPDALPPGIESIEVDGQPVDSQTVPVTGKSTPAISGRAEPGTPPLELAVGDDNAILFTAEINDRGRFRVTVPQTLTDGQYALSVNGVPVGMFAVQSGTTANQERDEPIPLLDIARVVPYPADFDDQVPGIGFIDGRFYTLQEEAERTAAAAGRDSARNVADIQRALTQAGWLQRYESRLAAPSADNSDTFDVQFTSFVVEYTSPEDAGSAFATLVSGDPVADAPVIGDQSTLTLFTGVTPDTGVAYQAARLVFRVGSMLGMIVYADLLDHEPDLVLLNSVAQRVAERAAVVTERETDPLGSMGLKLDPAAASTLARRDLYNVRAGTLTALYGEDDARRQSRVELFTGTTDAFSSTTNGTFALDASARPSRGANPPAQVEAAPPAPTSVISIEGEPAESAEPAVVRTPEPAVVETEPDTALVFMTTSLFAFPGEPEADTWLKSQRDSLIASDTTSAGTFTEVPDGPSLGDAAATFTTRRTVGEGEQTVGGFRMYSRLGDIVAVLEIESSSEVPIDGAARLMRFQIECIERQGCSGLASVSQNIFGNEEDLVVQKLARARPEDPEPPPAEQPAVVMIEEPTPAPVTEPAAAPVEEPALVPVEEPAPAPIEEPTVAPVEEPAPEVVEEAPIEEPVEAPSEEPTPAPVEEPTPVPVEESTPPVAEEDAPAPSEEPAPEIVEEPIPAAGEEPTAAPSEEPAPPPSEEPAPPSSEEPAPEATEEEPPVEDDESAPDGQRDPKQGRNARERIRDWREEHPGRSDG
jgi:hypothetical protein